MRFTDDAGKIVTASALIAVLLAACTPADADYYPVENGAKYRYIAQTTLGKTDIELAMLPARTVGGHQVTPLQQRDGSLQFVRVDDTGIAMIGKQSAQQLKPELYPSPEYELKYPVTVGTKWDAHQTLWLLHLDVKVPTICSVESTNETVSVPSGTYDKVVLVKCVGAKTEGRYQFSTELHQWFAPGVGKVKVLFRNASHSETFGVPVDQEETLVLQLAGL